MAEERRRKKSNLTVWLVLGLLVLALGGFGIGGFGGGQSSVADVGDREITVEDYGRALQAEQARLGEQTGQTVTLQMMRQFGLDRQVIERLLAGAALEEEAVRVGLSVGDAEVARQIRATPAFQGFDGGFDRDGYRAALQNAGLNEATAEGRIRDETARRLLSQAVIGGIDVPGAYGDRLTAWLAETRDMTLGTITEADLRGGALSPSDADLQAFYDADPERFRTPERRAITYDWVTPDMLVDGIDADEDALRALYEARADEFRQPERVLAERLAFQTEAEAQTARDAIDAGETTFDALVEGRGLTLQDVDQGEVARDGLDPAAADAIFALDEPGIAGPVPTPLGQALYRVNAILDATETPFETVRADLAEEFAQGEAQKRIDAAREEIDDALAGGATLEELAQETDMLLGTIEWDAEVSDGIAAYAEFREAAIASQPGDFPELRSLSDGGLFAMRVDAVIEPAVPPLTEIRDRVAAAWTVETQRRRLTERAEALVADPVQNIAGTPEVLTDLARDSTLEGVPPAVIERLFAAEPGDVLAVAGDETEAYVLRVDAVHPADETADRVIRLREAIETQTGQEIASDVFESYGRAVEDAVGVSLNQQAVEAVQTQLGGGG